MSEKENSTVTVTPSTSGSVSLQASNDQPPIYGYLIIWDESRTRLSHIFGIGKNVITIGRGSKNDIRLNARVFSRVHCAVTISEVEGGIKVELKNESQQKSATRLIGKVVEYGASVELADEAEFFLQGRRFMWLMKSIDNSNRFNNYNVHFITESAGQEGSLNVSHSHSHMVEHESSRKSGSPQSSSGTPPPKKRRGSVNISLELRKAAHRHSFKSSLQNGGPPNSTSLAPLDEDGNEEVEAELKNQESAKEHDETTPGTPANSSSLNTIDNNETSAASMKKPPMSPKATGRSPRKVDSAVQDDSTTAEAETQIITDSDVAASVNGVVAQEPSSRSTPVRVEKEAVPTKSSRTPRQATPQALEKSTPTRRCSTSTPKRMSEAATTEAEQKKATTPSLRRSVRKTQDVSLVSTPGGEQASFLYMTAELGTPLPENAGEGDKDQNGLGDEILNSPALSTLFATPSILPSVEESKEIHEENHLGNNSVLKEATPVSSSKPQGAEKCTPTRRNSELTPKRLSSAPTEPEQVKSTTPGLRRSVRKVLDVTGTSSAPSTPGGARESLSSTKPEVGTPLPEKMTALIEAEEVEKEQQRLEHEALLNSPAIATLFATPEVNTISRRKTRSTTAVVGTPLPEKMNKLEEVEENRIEDETVLNSPAIGTLFATPEVKNISSRETRSTTAVVGTPLPEKINKLEQVGENRLEHGETLNSPAIATLFATPEGKNISRRETRSSQKVNCVDQVSSAQSTPQRMEEEILQENNLGSSISLEESVLVSSSPTQQQVTPQHSQETCTPTRRSSVLTPKRVAEAKTEEEQIKSVTRSSRHSVGKAQEVTLSSAASTPRGARGSLLSTTMEALSGKLSSVTEADAVENKQDRFEDETVLNSPAVATLFATPEVKNISRRETRSSQKQVNCVEHISSEQSTPPKVVEVEAISVARSFQLDQATPNTEGKSTPTGRRSELTPKHMTAAIKDKEQINSTSTTPSLRRSVRKTQELSTASTPKVATPLPESTREEDKNQNGIGDEEILSSPALSTLFATPSIPQGVQEAKILEGTPALEEEAVPASSSPTPHQATPNALGKSTPTKRRSALKPNRMSAAVTEEEQVETTTPGLRRSVRNVLDVAVTPLPEKISSVVETEQVEQEQNGSKDEEILNSPAIATLFATPEVNIITRRGTRSTTAVMGTPLPEKMNKLEEVDESRVEDEAVLNSPATATLFATPKGKNTSKRGTRSLQKIAVLKKTRQSPKVNDSLASPGIEELFKTPAATSTPIRRRSSKLSTKPSPAANAKKTRLSVSFSSSSVRKTQKLGEGLLVEDPSDATPNKKSLSPAKRRGGSLSLLSRHGSGSTDIRKLAHEQNFRTSMQQLRQSTNLNTLAEESCSSDTSEEDPSTPVADKGTQTLTEADLKAMSTTSSSFVFETSLKDDVPSTTQPVVEHTTTPVTKTSTIEAEVAKVKAVKATPGASQRASVKKVPRKLPESSVLDSPGLPTLFPTEETGSEIAGIVEPSTSASISSVNEVELGSNNDQESSKLDTSSNKRISARGKRSSIKPLPAKEQASKEASTEQPNPQEDSQSETEGEEEEEDFEKKLEDAIERSRKSIAILQDTPEVKVQKSGRRKRGVANTATEDEPKLAGRRTRATKIVNDPVKRRVSTILKSNLARARGQKKNETATSDRVPPKEMDNGSKRSKRVKKTEEQQLPIPEASTDVDPPAANETTANGERKQVKRSRALKNVKADKEQLQDEAAKEPVIPLPARRTRAVRKREIEKQAGEEALPAVAQTPSKRLRGKGKTAEDDVVDEPQPVQIEEDKGTNRSRRAKKVEKEIPAKKEVSNAKKPANRTKGKLNNLQIDVPVPPTPNELQKTEDGETAPAPSRRTRRKVASQADSTKPDNLNVESNISEDSISAKPKKRKAAKIEPTPSQSEPEPIVEEQEGAKRPRRANVKKEAPVDDQVESSKRPAKRTRSKLVRAEKNTTSAPEEERASINETDKGDDKEKVSAPARRTRRKAASQIDTAQDDKNVEDQPNIKDETAPKPTTRKAAKTNVPEPEQIEEETPVVEEKVTKRPRRAKKEETELPAPADVETSKPSKRTKNKLNKGQKEATLLPENDTIINESSTTNEESAPGPARRTRRKVASQADAPKSNIESVEDQTKNEEDPSSTLKSKKRNTAKKAEAPLIKDSGRPRRKLNK